MALINVGASLPSYVWAVARFLLSVGGQYPTDRARELLCPATLMPGDTTTFSRAVGTLKDLALMTDDDGELSLSPTARRLSADDVVGFSDLLRRAVLDETQNVGLDGSGDQTRTKDAGAKTWSARWPGSLRWTRSRRSAWMMSPNSRRAPSLPSWVIPLSTTSGGPFSFTGHPRSGSPPSRCSTRT